MRHLAIAPAVLALSALIACDQPTAPLTADARRAEGGKKSLSAAHCALSRGDFTLSTTNPYFPLGVGSTWLLQGEEEGEQVELRVTVLDETEVVGGVTTRVVEERETADGELTEVSRNFFVETSEGFVCYFGEDVDIYEEGEIVSHEGSWRAGVSDNVPGIFLPADPRPGMRFQTEGAPGVAEDEGRIVGSGPARVPAGTFTETIRVREFNPLDGEVDHKVFAKDVGIVIDGPLSLVSYTVTG